MLNDEERTAFLESIERVRESVVTHLGANGGTSIAVGFVSNLHRAVDKVAQQGGEAGPKTDCTAGCTYCCSVRIEASDPEIFYIAREVKKRPKAQVDALTERLQRHVAASKADDAPSHRTACAFLESQLCSIYAIRPAVCRKAHSLSVESCRNLDPEIPQNLELVLQAEALMKGTSEAYRQVKLHASAHELCHGVLLALTDETAEPRWHGGASVFPDVHA